MGKRRKHRNKPGQVYYPLEDNFSAAEIDGVTPLGWVNHVSRSFSMSSVPLTQSSETEQVTIEVAVLEGSCNIDKDKLMAKSGFFQAMLSNAFQESSTGVVELHDDDPTAIATLLQYIVRFSEADRQTFITQWYDLWTDFPPGQLPPSILEWLQQVVLVSDKYMAPGLRGLAIFKLEIECCSRLSFASSTDKFIGMQKLFLREHYHPCRLRWGEYPKILYPVFTGALSSYKRENGAVGKMQAAMNANPGLNTYVRAELGHMAFYDDLRIVDNPDEQTVS